MPFATDAARNAFWLPLTLGPATECRVSKTEAHALWIGSQSKVSINRTAFFDNRSLVQGQNVSKFDGAVINTANEGVEKAKGNDEGAKVWFVNDIDFKPDPAGDPSLFLVDLACNAHL